MEEPQATPPAASTLGERYTIQSEQATGLLLVDQQPWKRCWACGSVQNEPGERFCTDCGAELANRSYRAVVTPAGANQGVALIPQITANDPAMAALPVVWDQVEQDGKTYTLLADSGLTALELPLDELRALRAGLGLARLQKALHQSGLLLGTISAEHLALSGSGEPRLLNAPELQRSSVTPEGVRGDLQALAGVLEALTATPRTTRRFDETQAQVSPETQAGMTELLRALRTGDITDAEAAIARIDELILDRTSPLPFWPRIGAASNTGMVRDHNEDSLFYIDLRLHNNGTPRNWGLYVVADGMGGHAGGEVASDLAIRGAAEVVMSDYLQQAATANAPFDEAAMREIVRRAVLRANEYVVNEAHARSNDMGTTITLALVVGNRAVIGNVGDSRTYLWRDGALRRVSRDHSLVMRLVELGQISEDDIYSHPQRNAVLRSLGDKLELEVDLFTERLKPGDALLLCSDGQWEMTRNSEMATILSQFDDPQQACNILIERANQAGGEDNITAIVVRFDEALS